jgi:predicted dehydrogenase
MLVGGSALGLCAALGGGLAADAREQAAPARRTGAADDKPGFALIGAGGRGRNCAAVAKRFGRLVAIADVDSAHAENAAAELVGESDAEAADVRIYKDFRELLDKEKDVKVVLNGTPDHWHTLVNLHALRSGRDVYSEKPLTLTIDEGKHLVRVVRETKAVLQTGSQQRSDPYFQAAVEIVRDGRVGTLRQITTLLPPGPVEGPFKAAEPPATLDWDFWLGQAPKVQYVAERCHRSFRYWLDYSGGSLTDWGAHHNDVALWAMDLDRSGPVTIEGRALVDRIPGGYTAPGEYSVEYTYANGARHLCRTARPVDDPVTKVIGPPPTNQTLNGVMFEGDTGWLFVRRGQLAASDDAIIADKLPPAGTKTRDATAAHMANFFRCVRTRQAPVADVEIGHRSTSVSHLGVIAILTGRKLHWDPQNEQFLSDEDATRYLRREMRKPWSYEAV